MWILCAKNYIMKLSFYRDEGEHVSLGLNIFQFRWGNDNKYMRTTGIGCCISLFWYSAIKNEWNSV